MFRGYNAGTPFPIPDLCSTTVKRLVQFFASFREISFTMRWKNKQGHTYNS